LKKYLTCLLWMMLLEAQLPWFLVAHYVVGFQAIWLFKFIPIFSMGTIIVFHLYNSVRMPAISKAFLLVGVVGFPLGVVVNGLRPEGIDFGSVYSHAFACALPILAISFGMHFYERKTAADLARVSRYFQYAFTSTCVVVIVYVGLYQAGVIAYWGLGTPMQFYIPFLLAGAKYRLALLGLLLVLLSGKRATSLTVVFELLYFSLASVWQRKQGRTLILTLYGVAAAAGLVVMANLNALDRFQAIAQISFDDPYTLLVAFSGRWEEVVGVLQYMEAHPGTWLFGAGAGGAYNWVVLLSDYEEVKSYAHFMPVAYLFKFGLPFTLFVYCYFVRLMVKNRAHFADPYYLSFCACVIASMFGANLLIDVLPWFFCGYVVRLGARRTQAAAAAALPAAV
jgi:hypothetical protein